MLLENAGPKAKDIGIRSMAIDILGTIAARLKHESVLCRREKLWVVQELVGGEIVNENEQTDTCSVCLDGVVEKTLVICQGCQRSFHPDCMGVREHDIAARGWQCPLCLCRKQLLVLESFCKSQLKGNCKNDLAQSENLSDKAASKLETVQQMLLNYLEDLGSSDDLHLFVCWYISDFSLSSFNISYFMFSLRFFFYCCTGLNVSG